MQSGDRRQRGNLAAMGSIFCWSTVLPLMRSVSEAIGALTATFLTFFLGALLGLFLRRRQLSVVTLRALKSPAVLLCGFLFALHEFSVSLAIGIASTRTASTTAYLINYLWPTLTVALGVVAFRQRGSLVLLVALALAFTGVAFGIAGDQGMSLEILRTDWAACLMALVAAFAWALYSNFTRLFSDSVPPEAVPFFMLLNGLIALVFRSCTSEVFAPTLTTGIELLVMVSLGPIGYILWDRATRDGELTFIGIIANSTPIVSTILASLYFSMVIPKGIWIGLVLLVTAGLLASRSRTVPLPT